MTAINFNNIEIGYEQFAKFMRESGFDWKTASKKGIKARCSINNDKSQLAFELPANGKMVNGQNPIEFGVLAGMFSGVQQTLGGLQKQTGKKWNVVALSATGNNLLFSVE